MVYDSGDYDKLFDEAVVSPTIKNCSPNAMPPAQKGAIVGIGVAGCIEASGPGASKVASLGSGVGFWESGSIRVHPSGKVTVFTGSHSHGQGS